jgi:hypothetical protein
MLKTEEFKRNYSLIPQSLRLKKKAESGAKVTESMLIPLAYFFATSCSRKGTNDPHPDFKLHCFLFKCSSNQPNHPTNILLSVQQGGTQVVQYLPKQEREKE